MRQATNAWTVSVSKVVTIHTGELCLTVRLRDDNANVTVFCRIICVLVLFRFCSLFDEFRAKRKKNQNIHSNGLD